MGPRLKKLLSIASNGFLDSAAVPDDSPVYPDKPLRAEYREVLRRKNGFFAFEQALHFFPLGKDARYRDVEQWNCRRLWRHGYEDLTDGLTFFAEDLFGGQFAFRGREVVRFDPETGEATPFAPSLEGWAARILEEYEVETGQPLAHAWQAERGPLPVGHRLIPRLPFVLGGEYDTDNLVARDAVEGMKIRAALAVQLRDLPDGSSITFEIGD